MKKLFVNFMLVAVAAMAFVSCSNDIDNTPVFDNEELITVTLKADKTCTRTEMIEGVPYWSKDDAIGAYFYNGEDYKNYMFTNDSNEASLTTTFTGQTAVSDVLYVYYPYTPNGASVNGAKVDIPATQYPTATSFDGAADIMIAKPITLEAEGKQLENLEFARLGAIVKIVLKDNTSKLSNQHISSLTMTAESYLVGRVCLDAVNQTLGELYNGPSKSVTANYDAKPLAIEGDNAIYLIVYPQTLTTGTELKFEASTEGYAIAKSITLPQDIELIGGAINTLNVTINAEHLTAEDAGLALPFEDDFSWVGTTSTTAFSSVTNKFPTRDEAAMYSACATIYPENNTALKFSSSNYGGTLTTSELNLSEPFSVVVNAKGYNDELSMSIAVGSQTKNITLTADYADYIVEFDAVSKKEKLTISGGKKQRFYLNDLKIVAGHDYVLPPVLTVSTDAESGVSSNGGEFKFTYSVANPVEGTNVAITDNVDWITTSDNNSGTVTVTVAENIAEETREGEITVTYGDLQKKVKVTQKGKVVISGNVAVGTVLLSETWGTYTGAVSSYKFTGTTVYGEDTSGLSYSVSSTNVKIESTTANPITTNNCFFDKSGKNSLTINGISLYGAKKVTLSYDVNRTNMQVTYSVDNGSAQTCVTSSTSGTNNKTIEVSGNTLTLVFTDTSTSNNIRLDNIKIVVAE